MAQALTGRKGASVQAEFEALAVQHRPELYRMALQITRNPDEAEDLVQETFLRAFSRFHQFEPGTNFRAWARRILTNAHINRYRHERRGPSFIGLDDMTAQEDFHLSGENAAREDQPERAIFDRLQSEEVEEAVRGLPEEFRQVLVLSDIEDFSYEQISRVLSIPIGTVRSRLFRARRRLRQRLTRYALEMGFIRESDLCAN
jgi:RNA polymerase sigma-70 factor (ECF subfamily)